LLIQSDFGEGGFCVFYHGIVEVVGSIPSGSTNFLQFFSELSTKLVSFQFNHQWLVPNGAKNQSSFGRSH
jgi:hypothetical protein